jgi:replicative DNA helicase
VHYDEEPPEEGTGLNREPACDKAAERALLGGIMSPPIGLAIDPIDDTVDAFKGVGSGVFYVPMHAFVYDAALYLHDKAQPVDPITVGEELTKRGLLTKVGGPAALHAMVQECPSPSSVQHYADIILDAYRLRSLESSLMRSLQMVRAREGDTDDIVDTVQSDMHLATAAHVQGQDYRKLVDLLEGSMDEIESIQANQGVMTGIPTGFIDLDSLTNGLHPGQMVVIAGRPGSGKALALDTPLPTPTGWTTMGEVQVGDRLIGADGKPTTVTAATGVMHDRPCYRMTFDDGAQIVADADHQWLATARHQARYGSRNSKPRIITTKEMTPKEDSGIRSKYLIDTCAPIQLDTADLPVPVTQYGVDFATARNGDPIHPAYLRASLHQRGQLLTGIMNTIGRVDRHGTLYAMIRGTAAADSFGELLSTLGYRWTYRIDKAKQVGGLPTVRVSFATADAVFSDADTNLLHRIRYSRRSSPTGVRVVVAVEEVPSVPVRCVQVDNDDHMYLAGNTMIPTHNSTLAVDMVRAASIRHGLPSMFFSLEMSSNELSMRILSAEARVALHHMRTGNVTDDDWNRIAGRMGALNNAPLFIDDSANLTMHEIASKARRAVQKEGVRLVAVDYLQLMRSGKTNRNAGRQEEVSDMSRNIKLLAKELGVPILCLSQLNRGPEQRVDKKPMVSDLRESGSIEQDADMVILVHREDMYEKESPRAGEADLIVAKHRNGPTATITVAFQGHYSKFVDMANT